VEEPTSPAPLKAAGQPSAKKSAGRKTAPRKTGSRKTPAAVATKKTAAKPNPKATAPTEPSDADIRLRAYFIAERRVQLALEGDPANDWLAAKQELLQEARQRQS